MVWMVSSSQGTGLILVELFLNGAVSRILAQVELKEETASSWQTGRATAVTSVQSSGHKGRGEQSQGGG